MNARIYLDHAATTPMLPQAIAAVAEGMARWANPSSPHREGREARAALEGARARIKTALGWKHHLIFTSGATEAAAIALTRLAQPRAAFVAAVEHSGVLRQRPDAVILPVDGGGLIEVQTLDAMLPGKAGAVVAIQHANSETGVVQPVPRLAERISATGGLLFCDCAQTAGRMALPPADLIAVSAHKLGGPPGIGALLVRDLGMLAPHKGAQELGYRAGTENLPAALSFAAALEGLAGDEAPWLAQQLSWRAQLDAMITHAGGQVIAARSPRTATIASYRMPGMSAEAQLIGFDLAGFAVSAGSACSSGAMHVSHVLAAMGVAEKEAGEVIRVSFGRMTTWDEIERFALTWRAVAGRRKAA